MKYSEMDWGTMEAVVNKLGGIEGVARFLRGEVIVTVPSVDDPLPISIFKIDRTNPFNPAKFIGKGWSIWRGPKDGDGRKGKEEQDERSLALTEIDPAKLLMQTGLIDGETYVTGEDKLARLIVKAIQVDAKIGQALYEEEGQKTLMWIYETLKVTWIEFLGTILRSPSGYRDALYLYREGDGSWNWDYHWLDYDRNVDDPAVGLAE